MIISAVNKNLEIKQRASINKNRASLNVSFPTVDYPKNILKASKIPFYGISITAENNINSADEQSALIKKNSFTNADYKKAKAYYKSTIEKLSTYTSKRELADFDLNKLNGFQKGIKVFEGLSMKEIACIASKIDEITVNRGCSNRCSHCYAEAVPHYFKNDSSMISKMSWEDYSSLLNGLGELNNRLGFNSIAPFSHVGFISLFRDSDCIEMEMTDSNGKIYDYKDATDLLYRSINKRGLFDTSGWPPKNKKLQERAEKFVEYFSDNENYGKMEQVNISINPFHGLNAKSIHYHNIGNEIGYQKMRDLYTDRMANVLYTFTPLLKNNKRMLNCFVKVMDNPGETPEGYDEGALVEINAEILKKLTKMYQNDFRFEKKYIKNRDEISEYIKLYDLKLSRINNVANIGRASNLFNTESAKDKNMKEHNDRRLSHEAGLKYGNRGIQYSDVTVDVNGKIYFTKDFSVVPSTIQLNFDNKNKNTKPFANQSERLIITSEMIDSVF